MSTAGRVLLAASGAGAARGLLAAAGAEAAGSQQADSQPADSKPAGTGRWLERSNYRGQPVNLIGGPVLALVASASAYAGAPRTRLARSALLLGLAAGTIGAYDDVAGQRAGQRTDKGIAGHLAALRGGRLSAGSVKTAGLGIAALIAARAVAVRTADRLVSAGLIAGAANLLNLFDLRPGRALKVALLAGVPLLAAPAGAILAGPLGAATAILPVDLAEQTMLGDAGANSLGALLGLALAAGTGRTGRAVALAGIVGLTAASERVSFTAVIERTAPLRALDELGRHRPLHGE